MHERVADLFADLSDWVVIPEATFAVYGERGVIDWLAWHPATRTLLVIELKTALIDIQELLGTLDRKRRLAPEIARRRGWFPAHVGTWLIVAEAARNRRAICAHRSLLGRVFTADGHAVRRWLRAPTGAIQALSFLSISRPEARRPKAYAGPTLRRFTSPHETGRSEPWERAPTVSSASRRESDEQGRHGGRHARIEAARRLRDVPRRSSDRGLGGRVGAAARPATSFRGS